MSDSEDDSQGEEPPTPTGTNTRQRRLSLEEVEDARNEALEVAEMMELQHRIEDLERALKKCSRQVTLVIASFVFRRAQENIFFCSALRTRTTGRAAKYSGERPRIPKKGQKSPDGPKPPCADCRKGERNTSSRALRLLKHILRTGSDAANA